MKIEKLKISLFSMKQPLSLILVFIAGGLTVHLAYSFNIIHVNKNEMELNQIVESHSLTPESAISEIEHKRLQQENETLKMKVQSLTDNEIKVINEKIEILKTEIQQLYNKRLEASARSSSISVNFGEQKLQKESLEEAILQKKIEDKEAEINFLRDILMKIYDGRAGI